MQITDWVLQKIQKGEPPEEIARHLALNRPTAPQWEALIKKAKEIDDGAEIRPYLLTLFHAAHAESDWLWLRVLGIIAQTPAFDPTERQNAVTSIEKRLDRLKKAQQANPDAEAEAQLAEYSAYLLVLKGALHAEGGEIAQTRLLYQQARAMYQELNNTAFVSWLDGQIAQLPAPAAAETRPAIHLKSVREAAAPPAAHQETPPARSGEADAELRSLREQLAERDRRLSILPNLEKEMASLRQQNAKLRTDLQARTQELEALRREQNQPDVRDRSEMDELRQALEDKTGEVEELRDDLRRKEQQVIDLQRDVQNRHDQAGNLRRQLQLSQDKIKQLESDLEEARGNS